MTGNAAVDPVELAQALIRCDSVTPREGGALALLQDRLQALGFACHRLRFEAPGTEPVENLYARLGTVRPNFCFAGHTDVVPVGDAAAWGHEPFGAEIAGGTLYGRGATDMKGAIAAFIAAAAVLAARPGGLMGSISLLITGDEEGPAVNGTVRVLDWLAGEGERLDHCLVGEPTNPDALGEMVKIGRRGSLTGHLRVKGVQGHVAYPHLADNPVPRLLAVLSRLCGHRLDEGNAHFQPSNLEVTTIDIGNPAGNVIPAEARASFNVRFNTEHTAEALCDWLRAQCAELAGEHELELSVGARPFLTEPGPFTDLLAEAVEAVTGRCPELSTTGGTSDARFIQAVCPVAEFGLIGQTMHKVDERAEVADIRALAAIYQGILELYFERFRADA